LNCAQVRELARLYLDSELDAKATLEVEQHLERCAECTDLFRAEHRFDERLTAALRPGRPTAALWQAFEHRIRPAARRLHFRRRWPLGLAAAVALAVALAAGWWARSRPLDLGAAAAECHRAYERKIVSVEFTAPAPAQVPPEFGDGLLAAAFAYRPADAAFEARGARFCHMSGVPVAMILGEYRTVPFSIIIFRKADLGRFPGTERRLESGETMVCGRAGRYQFGIRLMNDHVVCLIGKASRPAVEELLRSVVRSA
jgi:anti-sigma factor RsiW